MRLRLPLEAFFPRPTVIDAAIRTLAEIAAADPEPIDEQSYATALQVLSVARDKASAWQGPAPSDDAAGPPEATPERD